jgi:2-polyprenyl-3-methyl-5-hydroxy-6-metoxy-1,4-benzoquinol methylase
MRIRILIINIKCRNQDSHKLVKNKTCLEKFADDKTVFTEKNYAKKSLSRLVTCLLKFGDLNFRRHSFHTNKMSIADTDMITFYSNWSKFNQVQIEELRKTGKDLTYKDYQPIDTLNVVQTKSAKYFMEKYQPGKKIVDIGAGMGGPVRMIAAEYGCEPVGLEYVMENVEMGNEISRSLGLPELLQFGDATVPLSVSNMDGAILHGVISAIPRERKLMALQNTFNCLKPGGLLFYEDICFECLYEEFPVSKHHGLEKHPHLHNCEYRRVMRQQLLAVGFEIVEYEDVSKTWSEAAWQHAEEDILPVFEDTNVEMSATEKAFMEF